MQDLTKMLGTLLQCRKQFKVKFEHLNDDDGTYFPVYYTGSNAIKPRKDEIVAWWWGSTIKIGQVSSVHEGTSLVVFVPRNKPTNGKLVHAQVRHSDIVARFVSINNSPFHSII